MTKAQEAALLDNPDVAFEEDELGEPPKEPRRWRPRRRSSATRTASGWTATSTRATKTRAETRAAKAKGETLKEALAAKASDKKSYEEAGFDPATLPQHDWPGWEAYRLTEDRERAYMQAGDGLWYYLVAQFGDEGEIVNYVDPGSPPSTPTGGGRAQGGGEEGRSAV